MTLQESSKFGNRYNDITNVSFEDAKNTALEVILFLNTIHFQTIGEE